MNKKIISDFLKKQEKDILKKQDIDDYIKKFTASDINDYFKQSYNSGIKGISFVNQFLADIYLSGVFNTNVIWCLGVESNDSCSYIDLSIWVSCKNVKKFELAVNKCYSDHSKLRIGSLSCDYDKISPRCFLIQINFDYNIVKIGLFE